MSGKLPSKEKRLAALGVTALEPGEVSTSVRIRASKEVLEALSPLTAKEKGQVVEAGLRALGLLGEMVGHSRPSRKGRRVRAVKSAVSKNKEP